MAVPLLPAESAQYSAIIDDILATSDLQTISAKTIRRGLQARLEIDVSEKKDAVQQLIMERFDIATQRAAAPPAANGHGKTHDTVNRASATHVSRAASTPLSDVDDEPPKKKRKTPAKSKSSELDDEQYAKMLQEQENRSSRATRGAAKVKVSKKVTKKVRKQKSAKKVKAEDDSDLDEVGSDGEVKEKERKGGFHKKYHLSAPLADLIGEPTLSRPQVVKKIWEYIKERDLQDPNDKRQILCDERMQLVFKQDKVHMFTMNKILGNQLYEVEEE